MFKNASTSNPVFTIISTQGLETSFDESQVIYTPTMIDSGWFILIALEALFTTVLSLDECKYSWIIFRLPTTTTLHAKRNTSFVIIGDQSACCLKNAGISSISRSNSFGISLCRLLDCSGLLRNTVGRSNAP